MKVLSTKDLTQISGGGYYEDITMAASTLYVGNYIGALAGGFTQGILQAMATQISNPLGSQLCMNLSMIMPAAYMLYGPIMAYKVLSTVDLKEIFKTNN